MYIFYTKSSYVTYDFYFKNVIYSCSPKLNNKEVNSHVPHMELLMCGSEFHTVTKSLHMLKFKSAHNSAPTKFILKRLDRE